MNQDNKIIATAIEVFRMHNINEFRLVGKILNIGKIFTYPNGTQILICNVQTVIDGETMNHSVNFYDELAQELIQTAVNGQQINIDGSLMAIEHEKDGRPQTYFGLKAKRYYLLAIVQVNKHSTARIPPLPNNTPQRQPNRSNSSNKQQNNQQQRPQANTQAQRQQVQNTTSNQQSNQAQRQQAQNTTSNQVQPQQRQQVQNTTPNQQPNQAQQHSTTQNFDNWADDIDWTFSQGNTHNSNQTVNQPQHRQPNEEIVLVGQDATPKQNKNTQTSIGGVPIDTSLPFNRS